jgi:hypothetical protein
VTVSGPGPVSVVFKTSNVPIGTAFRIQAKKQPGMPLPSTEAAIVDVAIDPGVCTEALCTGAIVLDLDVAGTYVIEAEATLAPASLP